MHDRSDWQVKNGIFVHDGRNKTVLYTILTIFTHLVLSSLVRRRRWRLLYNQPKHVLGRDDEPFFFYDGRNKTAYNINDFYTFGVQFSCATKALTSAIEPKHVFGRGGEPFFSNIYIQYCTPCVLKNVQLLRDIYDLQPFWLLKNGNIYKQYILLYIKEEN
jgi:hypothetical protein